MHLPSHFTGENRLLSATLKENVAARKAARIAGTPIVNAQPVPYGTVNVANRTYQNVPSPQSSGSQIQNGAFITPPSAVGTVSTGISPVSPGYDINLDPTYSGTKSKELTGWTGTESTSGNVGPTAGFTGSRSDWNALMQKEADAYASSVSPSTPEGVGRDFNAEAVAREQAKQTYYTQKQAEIAKQRADAERAQRQAGSIGYNLQAAVDENLTNRLTKLDGTRGDFVDQKRTEINPQTGKIYSDQEIKRLLQSMPVGTFENEQASQQQTQTPSPIEPQTPPPAPVTPQGSQTPTNGTGTMQKDGTSQGSQDMPQAPIYPPQASAVRDMMTQLAKDNPLVGLYAAMYDEDVMRTEEAKASALLSLGASIQGAEQENLDTQAYIDKWVNIANQNSNKLTGILQSNNDETNKVLEQQKNNALQKLEFDRQVQTQQLEKQKAADVLKSSIAIGLRGGAYSGAAQNALAESEREWDVAIQNLGKEYSFKAADVMTDYTAKYVTAKQNLALNLLQASETLQNKIEGYANAGFSSLQAKKKAITQAHNDYRSTHDAMLKDHATNLKSYVKEMGEMVNKKRDDESKKRDQLWDRLFKQRASDGNLNPSFTRNILREMSDAGIDVSGIDPNTMTLDQTNEMYRRAKDAEDKANVGKVPLGQQVQQLRDADNAFDLLNKARETIANYANVGGPISGMTGLGDLDPSFLARAGKLGADIVTGLQIPGAANALERQREATAAFNLVKQVIGKAMEGGVLRKEDELKYEKLLPTLRDTDRLRKSKLEQLQQYMEDGKRNLLENMRSSGYNTSGFNLDASGKSYDPIYRPSTPNLTNEEVDEIMNAIENEEPISGTTGFLDALAMAHAKHEGFGTPNAITITQGNNVGALKFLPSMAEKYGATRGKNNFAMFPDVQSGYKALVADLRAKITGGSAHIDYANNPTLLDYIKVYAPDTDGNNPTSYSRAVVASLKKKGYDVDIHTPLSALSMYIS